MEPNIYATFLENVFANQEPGVEVFLFRHKIKLTIEEAKELKDILCSVFKEVQRNA